MSRVLVIAGMHRSGTSLAANWLSGCGLDVGNRLLGAARTNKAGHFEDLDFLEFHKGILKRNGRDYFVCDDAPVPVTPEDAAAARKMVRERADKPQWGWKEPRTCLFLDLWKSILPEAKMLAVYRHYSDVTDSLLRRELKVWQRSPGMRGAVWSALKYPWSSCLNRRLIARCLSTWRRYNREILDFAQRYPQDSLVFSVEDIVQRSDEIIASLNERWGFDLDAAKGKAAYVPGMMRSASSFRRMLLSAPSRGPADIMGRLEAAREASLRRMS